MEIDNKILHCKFFDRFISAEWSELRSSREGLEIARWRIHYWLLRWEKDIYNCNRCLEFLNSIKEGFSNAGIKFDFEPEIYFK